MNIYLANNSQISCNIFRHETGRIAAMLNYPIGKPFENCQLKNK